MPSLKQAGLKSCTPTTANQQCFKNLKIALMKASAIEVRSLFESPFYRWIATKMKRVRNYAVVFRAKYFLCEVSRCWLERSQRDNAYHEIPDKTTQAIPLGMA